MILTLSIIKFLFPFLLLGLFFCLYKKEYGFMKRFYCKTVTSFNARNLYCMALSAVLIFLNWCCYQTDSNWAVLFAAFMTGCLVFHRVADAVLHRLHERTRLWALTLMLALLCYAIPYMNSVFQVLYTVGVASVFYPSERVLRMKDEVNAIGNPHGLLHRILHLYY